MKMNPIIHKITDVVNSLILNFVKQSANSACRFYFHQPKFPEKANKYKRMKCGWISYKKNVAMYYKYPI